MSYWHFYVRPFQELRIPTEYLSLSRILLTRMPIQGIENTLKTEQVGDHVSTQNFKHFILRLWCSESNLGAMITVYIWNPSGTNVGHASAKIQGISKNAYISWWPKNSWKESLPGSVNSEQGDIEAEGRKPDDKCVLYGLNEVAGIAWWENLLTRKGHYQATTNNCAWAVISMLKASGADKKISWTSVMTRYNVPLVVLSPSIGLSLCVGTAAAALVGVKPTDSAMAFTNHCTAIWTPADAMKYARAIN